MSGKGERAGAPRDALEIELCTIWQSVLELPTVGVGDNFFLDLGGDSAACVRLLSEAETVFGADLSIASFYSEPTPAGMAARIRSGTSRAVRGPIIYIQAGQGGQPLFTFHPLGGTVLCYVPLARAIGSRHALWGLQSEGVEPQTTPLTSVEAMADHYVEHMRAVHSQGPWNLLGYSMGGFLAVEAARRLSAQGERVRFVGLIDTHASVGPAPPLDIIRGNAIRGIARLILHLDVDAGWPRLQGIEEQLTELRDRGMAAGTLPSDYGLDRLRRLVEVHVNNRIAIGNYHPETYRGTLTLIRSCPPSPAPHRASGLADRYLGWSGRADAIRVHDIPSDHFDIMSPPAVARVAEVVRGYIQDVDA